MRMSNIRSNTLFCEKCGSDNVCCKAWVYINDYSFCEFCETEEDVWCDDCCEMTDTVSVNQITDALDNPDLWKDNKLIEDLFWWKSGTSKNEIINWLDERSIFYSVNEQH